MTDAKRSMVVVRTPLRVSFVGGGSDLPGGEGAVVSSTIDKYVHVTAKLRRDGDFYVHWSGGREVVRRPEDLRHEIAREAILESAVTFGVELATIADVPAAGSGLGSSAATCVGMLHALLLLRGRKDEEIDRDELAKKALDIQVARLGKFQGGQDEFACALGGLRHMLFGPKEPRIPYSTQRLKLGRQAEIAMDETFLLFSPRSKDGRNADAALRTFNDSPMFRSRCKAICSEFSSAALYGDAAAMAFLVAQHDLLKRSAFGGYAPEGLAPDEDGIAWKLCGAGGTGHVLAACERARALDAVHHFEERWGPRLPFHFVDHKTQLVYEES